MEKHGVQSSELSHMLYNQVLFRTLDLAIRVLGQTHQIMVKTTNNTYYSPKILETLIYICLMEKHGGYHGLRNVNSMQIYF